MEEKWNDRTRLLTFCAAMLSGCIGLTGCAQPAIIGDWESSEQLGGQRDELELEEDERGAALIWVTSEGRLIAIEYDVEWREDGTDRYEVDLECDGDCASLDFTMDCEMRGDDDEMKCDADGIFNNFEFEWERR